jgi:hypothetical protein
MNETSAEVLILTINALAGGKLLKAALAALSPTARLRNGLQYLDFALAVLAAAKIDHLFLMIDQLEELATNQSVTAPKRSREIGRIRDLLESAPYATRLHMILLGHLSTRQDPSVGPGSEPVIDISHSNVPLWLASIAGGFLTRQPRSVGAAGYKSRIRQKSSHFLRAAVRGSWAGHRRDTDRP